jgi:hypothetical protein
MLVAVFAIGSAAAQQSSIVDLNDPKLQPHASLPLNNFPGPNLLQSLQPLVDEQASKGKINPMVYKVAHDEDTGFAPFPTLTAMYQDLTCHAEAVLTGKVSGSMAHLSASGGAIYSDYVFAVESVLKENPRAAIRPGAHIVVTRPGGSLPVTGGSVRYDNQAFLPLQSGGNYLLFLHQIGKTGAYEPASVEAHGSVFSTLQLSDSQWKIYRSAYLHRDFPELNSSLLLSNIRVPRCAQ